MKISVPTLNNLLACREGIEEFVKVFGEEAAVSVDELMSKAVELESKHLGWLIRNVGEHISPYFSCNWSKVCGNSWSWLLMERPQFAEHCNWDKLSGEDWSWLLMCQPQFNIHRPMN